MAEEEEDEFAPELEDRPLEEFPDEPTLLDEDEGAEEEVLEIKAESIGSAAALALAAHKGLVDPVTTPKERMIKRDKGSQ